MLPRLIEKAVVTGHRVLIVADDAALLKRIDVALWSHAPDAFLPHAVMGETDFAARQPVLLARGTADNVNTADLLAIVDGVLPETPGDWSRILYLFDGNDPAALARARSAWKRVRSIEGVSPGYWQESERGWTKAG